MQVAAPAVTAVWLNDILDHHLNPPRPDVRNCDGDELLFCTLQFPFTDAVLPDDIRSVLNERPELSCAGDTFWSWIALGKEAVSNKVKNTRKSAGLEILSTTGDHGPLILGTLEIRDRTLLVSVNSRQRAERARVLFTDVLGSRVGPPLTQMQSLEQSMAARPAAPKSALASLEIPPDLRRNIIHQSMDKHYGRMLNEPIPMLGNRSPREAVKTDAGRKNVVAWLKTLENHSAKILDSNDPVATYDFSWLWVELGVSAERR